MDTDFFDNLTLEEAIVEFNRWSRVASKTPWYVGDKFINECGDEEYSIGPTEDKSYEATIADFLGTEHNSEANAHAVIYAMFLVPKLIKRIHELESIISAEMPDEVTQAIMTIQKWKNEKSSK